VTGVKNGLTGKKPYYCDISAANSFLQLKITLADKGQNYSEEVISSFHSRGTLARLTN